MRRVSISGLAAKAWADWYDKRALELGCIYAHQERELRDQLRRAMEPKRKPRRPRRPRDILHSTAAEVLARDERKAQKREHRASIREAVFKRSEVNGVPRCEGPASVKGIGPPARCGNRPTQLAHAFGRGKGRRSECVENCMALCDVCAYQETNNIPDAGFWWNFRAEFFERNGYTAEARAARDRLAFVETRSMLGAGLKERAGQ